MEIMNKEEYLKDRMGKTLHKLVDIEVALNQLLGAAGEGCATNTAYEDISREFEIDDDEFDHFICGDFDGAYNSYIEENTPKLHDYAVSFSVPEISGNVHVKAESEEKAQEYVEANIIHNISRHDFDMCEDDDVINGIELEGETYGFDDIRVDDVEDYGPYEED